MKDSSLIDQDISLFKALMLLVGTALGMSIFIVPTQMLAQAGPSIIIAVLISVIPMIFAAAMLLQLSAAVPVAGGIYIYASRLVGPFWGLISLIVMPLITVWAYLLFAAIGFAQYLPILVNFLPVAVDIPITVGALVLLFTFILVNYFGIKTAANTQTIMVTLLLIGLFTFIVGGLTNFDSANFSPLFPSGEGEPFESNYGPFLLAVVLLYIPFQGFAMIIELGEEIDDPSKNIPYALIIGMGLVTILVLGLIAALVGSVPWEEAINPETGEPVEGGLATVMMEKSPGWSIATIAIGALVAAATTVNAMITSFSRTLMAASRDNMLPKIFSELNKKYNTPSNAVLLIGVPPVLGALLHNTLNSLTPIDLLDWLVVIVVSGIFISFIISSLALWRLPKKFPKLYENAWYKFPKPVVKFLAVSNILISTAFMYMIARTAPTALLFLTMGTLVGIIIYKIQTKRNSISEDIRQNLQQFQNH